MEVYSIFIEKFLDRNTGKPQQMTKTLLQKKNDSNTYRAQILQHFSCWISEWTTRIIQIAYFLQYAFDSSTQKSTSNVSTVILPWAILLACWEGRQSKLIFTIDKPIFNKPWYFTENAKKSWLSETYSLTRAALPHTWKSRETNNLIFSKLDNLRHSYYFDINVSFKSNSWKYDLC